MLLSSCFLIIIAYFRRHFSIYLLPKISCTLITPEGVQIFVPIFVELTLNYFLYFFKVQKFGIRYQMILSNLKLYSVLKDVYTIFYLIDRYNYIIVVVNFFQRNLELPNTATVSCFLQQTP